MEDYVSIAKKIFERSLYRASDEDVKRLADNMAILEKRGLGTLNPTFAIRGVYKLLSQ